MCCAFLLLHFFASVQTSGFPVSRRMARNCRCRTKSRFLNALPLARTLYELIVSLHYRLCKVAVSFADQDQPQAETTRDRKVKMYSHPPRRQYHHESGRRRSVQQVVMMPSRQFNIESTRLGEYQVCTARYRYVGVSHQIEADAGRNAGTPLITEWLYTT